MVQFVCAGALPYSRQGVGEAAWSAASCFLRLSSDRAVARLPAISACLSYSAFFAVSPFMTASLAASSKRFVLYDHADSLLGSYLIAVSASSSPRVTHFCMVSKSFWSLGFWYVTPGLPPFFVVTFTPGRSVILKEQSQSLPARIAYASARVSLDILGSLARAMIHSRSFVSSLIAA